MLVRLLVHSIGSPLYAAAKAMRLPWHAGPIGLVVLGVLSYAVLVSAFSNALPKGWGLPAMVGGGVAGY